MTNENALSHPASNTLQAGQSESREVIDFSFEQVFLKYFDRVLAVLIRLVGDRAQAEELADDVFWKLYQRPLPPTRDHNLGGWLYRTATRLGIDALRVAGRRRKYEEAAGRQILESDIPVDPLDEVIQTERCRQVRSVLARLKPPQVQLLILRHSGLSYKELADALGVKPSSIGTLLARAEADFEKLYRQLHQDKE